MLHCIIVIMLLLCNLKSLALLVSRGCGSTNFNKKAGYKFMRQFNAAQGTEIDASFKSVVDNNTYTLETVRRDIRNELLRWRNEVAEQTNKPLYLVLQNRQIDNILSKLPATQTELAEVPQIGPKTMTYGRKIVEIISKHLNAHPDVQITPLDIKPKVSIAKAGAKTFIATPDIRNLMAFNITFDDLTAEQKKAARLVIDRSNNVFITGSAGTGKSFLLRYIIQELRRKHGFAEVAVTAPTGIAAVNIGGTTVHSFAGIGIKEADPDYIIEQALKRKDVRARWKKLQVLIIDEISMLNINIFELLDKMAKKARKSSEPFGGLQLIVVGDFLQLPPVRATYNAFNSPTEARKQLFCFDSPSWSIAELDTSSSFIHLREVVRQRDEQFIDLLNRVRVGDRSKEILHMLDDCVIDKKPLPSDGIIPTKLYCLNRDVDAENNDRLAEIPEKGVVIEAEDEWKMMPISPLSKKRLQEAADKAAPLHLELKRNAQVVLLRNRVSDGARFLRGTAATTAKPLVNGSRGIVVGFVPSIDGGDLVPKVRFDDGQVVVIKKVEHEVHAADGDGMLVRSQIPLKLAWATTVHKSQGTTLSRAELMMNNAFDYGQTYVALSRVRSLEGLWLTKPIPPSSVKAHPEVLKFYNRYQNTKYSDYAPTV